MSFLNLKYPILQAPIGSAASVHLAASVSNSGGMGSLALTWDEPETAAQKVRDLSEKTENLFFVNLVIGFPSAPIEKILDATLEAEATVFTFSWGQPGKLIEKIHQCGSLAGVQVGSVAGAKQAIDDGADFVICQGIEAGGHVQSTTPLKNLLKSVVAIAGSVPIVGTGGLSNGSDLYQIMNLGASAAMLGTRFVATVESFAHPEYKQVLVEAESKSTIYTQCFNRIWPNAPHRILRNKTLDNWESAGCPQPGFRPGEEEVLAECSVNGTIMRYDDTVPVETTTGKISECCLYSGTGCGEINNIPTVDQLLSDIWFEYQSNSGREC